MIVDKKGKIFEDRRKNKDRRVNTVDATGGRRKTVRRKEDNASKKQILYNSYKNLIQLKARLGFLF